MFVVVKKQGGAQGWSRMSKGRVTRGVGGVGAQVFQNNGDGHAKDCGFTLQKIENHGTGEFWYNVIWFMC